ncbi:MAG: anaerobic ribonucleoside-triphosphate reductase activating protein [Candidatus Nomurabacteria bacterium]|jgi:anaerobic ribonucleoside-triphosphate reductase activating protein|nr:anaerobic ribonucleoside-triphosphate reductase activating protein [Candidatus Nomurabacteria bacterium]
MKSNGAKQPRWPEPDGTPLKLADDEVLLSGPLQSDSIVDGEGLRAVLWTQGCRRRCQGCHNPETWDEAGGFIVKIDDIKDQLRAMKGQTGLTFSGGEPMLQAKNLKKIADWARRELGWNIWSFSGYTHEQLREAGGNKWALVKSLDVLIDGPFILPERDLTLRFRGSRNQRLLRLEEGEIVSVE